MHSEQAREVREKRDVTRRDRMGEKTKGKAKIRISRRPHPSGAWAIPGTVLQHLQI